MIDAGEADDSAGRGRPLPLIAVLIGGAVLAIGAVATPYFIAPPLTTLAIGGALTGVALWIAALIAGLRSGPLWWIIISLALLVGGGALAGFGAFRIANADNAADASSFAELEFAPNGDVLLPSNPARGQASAAFAEAVRAGERDGKAYAARLSQLGVGVLNSPHLLAQAPGLLADCGSIGALEAQAAATAERQTTRLTTLGETIEAASLSPQIKGGVAAIVEAQAGATTALLTQERAMLAATQALCNLLARRSWSNDGGYFGFAGTADRAAFDAITQRRLAIEGERKRIRDAMKAQGEAGRDLVRDMLS